MSPGFAALLIAFGAVLALALGLELRMRGRSRDEGLQHIHPRRPAFDPERERQAEAKAAELMRSVVGDENWAMYADLGFLRARGRDSGGYAYLIYPHRPLVAYDESTGQLLNEYCVGFPDRSEPGAETRLPDSDDVLAKWMALIGDERGLIADANMHLPGRQVDPDQVRRDLGRLRHWDELRSAAASPVNNLSA